MLFRFAVVAATLLSSTFAADCARSYVVKEGDYCDAISATNDVSTYQLATLNTKSINAGCTNLLPGSTLCLGTIPAEDCTDTYTVEKGDTCGEIAATFGFNSTVLSLNNPQLDAECSGLYIGEVLCVAKDVKVPNAAGGVVVAPTPGKSENTPPSKNVKPPKNVAPAPAPVEDKPPAAAPPAQTPPAPAAPEVVGDDDDEELPWCDELDN